MDGRYISLTVRKPTCLYRFFDRNIQRPITTPAPWSSISYEKSNRMVLFETLVKNSEPKISRVVYSDKVPSGQCFWHEAIRAKTGD